MSYRILIKKTGEKKTTDSQYKKISDTGNEKDQGPIYGYVEYEKTIKFETDIYDQTIDEIDINAVIKAVNRL